ncbi:hypothetical protein MLD38_006537 [Melastoma candidum]|uniref:Uncharacterized protein n=1 Tax=Melastoma candidum TaxID=119954 RepID=A0ACB9RQ36_9MYRT|nr:hypothetical protein MLD38_006537 [Melastoma candidum]
MTIVPYEANDQSPTHHMLLENSTCKGKWSSWFLTSSVRKFADCQNLGLILSVGKSTTIQKHGQLHCQWFGVGTLLVCATVAAPRIDSFISSSQRSSLGMCRRCGDLRLITCTNCRGVRLLKAEGLTRTGVLVDLYETVWGGLGWEDRGMLEVPRRRKLPLPGLSRQTMIFIQGTLKLRLQESAFKVHRGRFAVEVETLIREKHWGCKLPWHGGAIHAWMCSCSCFTFSNPLLPPCSSLQHIQK